MATQFWSLTKNPEFPLILAYNRGEVLDREAEPAQWQDDGRALYGKDVPSGGTWLGISRTGKVAGLTNVFPPPPLRSMMVTRGTVVTTFLESGTSLDDVVNELRQNEDNLRAFITLLLPSVGGGAQLVTNNGDYGKVTARDLTPEEKVVGGFSNGIDGSVGTDWPNVKHGVEALTNLLDTVPPDVKPSQFTDRLFEILEWTAAKPPSNLQETKKTILVDPFQATVGGGVTYIASRTSTIIIVRKDGKALFIERDLWEITREGIRRARNPDRVFEFELVKE
ncbi:DUF833-domain-containing protein [Phlebopus sp. FC_14]|nr:DUF833-domain-containing protein [Phlebopus sp. FC_14]